MSTFDTHPVVWDLYFGIDKGRSSILRASAAWICAPAPVDAILRPVTA